MAQGPAPTAQGQSHAAGPLRPPGPLAAILDGQQITWHLDAAAAEAVELEPVPGTGVPGAVDGRCVECEDQPAHGRCGTCDEALCEVCFHFLHRKGRRREHVLQGLPSASGSALGLAQQSGTRVASATLTVVEGATTSPDSKEPDLAPTTAAAPHALSPSSSPEHMGQWYRERCHYIPVRLSAQERQYLLLLEAGLSVSQYTDKIDILTYADKTKGMVRQIRELCALLSGLLLSADYKAGQELFETRDFAANAPFYQMLFEIGRRHKIMNPEKMRNTYGKLMYLLQDSQQPHVAELLEFSCVVPIRTVYAALEGAGTLQLLDDPLLPTATMEILAEGRSRSAIQRDIRAKERAIEVLAGRYCQGEQMPREAVRQLIYSIGDNFAFLRTHRDPCDTLIRYLKEFFDPTDGSKRSLAIHGGYEGARLSHSHEKQFHYVLQSLSLWREILHEMFMLCSMAEEDLLDPSMRYRLVDTGQGLNRMQHAPRVSRVMHNILHRAQKRAGHWVGSSVIHLGDANVPNAFLFLDKYTQIYRILNPITTTLERIEGLTESSTSLATFLRDSYGGEGPRDAQAAILTDFFRHAFDGSGADNFNSAGSCIDGRLTSAWNWCSEIEKKVGHMRRVVLVTSLPMRPPRKALC